MARIAAVLVIASILVTAARATAQSVDGPAPLSMPSSVRFAAMGYAGTALIDDATEAGAVWFNPALAALPDYHQDGLAASFLNDPKIEEVESAQLFYGALGWSTDRWGLERNGRPARFFVTFSHARGDTIFTGNNLGEITSAFEPRQQVFAGGMAMQTTDSFSWGLTAKYVTVDLRPLGPVGEGFVTSDGAFVIDAGFIYREPASRFSWAATLNNVGSKLSLGRSDDTIPRTLRAGVAAQAMNEDRHDIRLAGDIVLPLVDLGDGPIIVGGAEYRYAGIIAGRAGFIYEDWFTNLNPINTYTLGIGLGYRHFRLDYGWVPDEAGHKSEIAIHFRMSG